MARYEAGIITRGKILKAYRKLFYQKGYDDTTFDDICREGNVTRGLIHYHFRAKYSIARIILAQFLTDHGAVVDKLVKRDFPDTPEYYFAAIHLRCYLSQMMSDEKLKRFYYEISRITQFTTAHIENAEIFLKRYLKAFGLTKPEIQVKFDTAALMGMSSSVNIMYMHGYLDTSLDEYIDHRIRLLYGIMHVDEKIIEKIILDIKPICSGIKIGVKNYFIPYAKK